MENEFWSSWKRKGESISVFISILCFLNICFSILLTLFLLSTQYYWIIFIYYIWIYIDRKTPETIYQEKKWVGFLPWWKKTGDYFPVKMLKSEEFELNPTKNYLFCSYPHGIIGFSMLQQSLDLTSDLYQLFPRSKFSIGTISLNYYIPFCREISMAFGCSSVTKGSLMNHLSCPDGGQAFVLMVGGSSEAAYCRPGLNKIILNERKGFIKIALETGSPLVPIYHFGLNDIYDQKEFNEKSFGYKLQKLFKKLTGINPILPRGVGPFGILPRRVPIFSVVGKPMEVPKITNPTREDVEKYHQMFKDIMVDLFEKEKYKYISNPRDAKLIVV